MIGAFISYIVYFAVMIFALVAATAAYVAATPCHEVEEIRRGNVAAAWALGGVMVGLAAVIYSATLHGSHLWLSLLWVAVAAVVQIAATEAIVLLFGGFKREMAAGSIAHGVALGAFSLAVGIVNAACVS